MKNRIFLFLATALFLYGCSSCNKNKTEITISPEAGTNYKSGADVTVKVGYPADMKPDSIVYLLDSARVTSKKDSSVLTLKTDTMRFGPRDITAKIYVGGKSQNVT